MENQHQIEIAPTQEIWEAIKEEYEYQNKKQEKKDPTKKVKRQVFLDYWKPKLQYFYEMTTKNIKIYTLTKVYEVNPNKKKNKKAKNQKTKKKLKTKNKKQ